MEKRRGCTGVIVRETSRPSPEFPTIEEVNQPRAIKWLIPVLLPLEDDSLDILLDQHHRLLFFSELLDHIDPLDDLSRCKPRLKLENKIDPALLGEYRARRKVPDGLVGVPVQQQR